MPHLPKVESFIVAHPATLPLFVVALFALSGSVEPALSALGL